MESDSDGEEEVFSGMKLPPLINQLKRILAEYPDGGQILKELIQNAEDADATEVKLLYDQRTINEDIKGGKEYRKFFRGPALCVYNNALFREEDWEGIRMIDMSVKESEPLKVGRFGLGFKSVFHLTDYPCVISGGRLLLIDPQKQRDKVNTMMKVDKLDKYKRMDVEAFFTALEGTFGINRDIIKTGSFQGTLFWFPLRNTSSELSSNVYNEEKMITLLESIRQEKQSLIIFLKSLTSIRIELRTPQDRRITQVIVEIENCDEVGRIRKDFKAGIDQLILHGGPAVECSLEMKINTSVISENGVTWENSSVTWLVVNYFMGNNASVEFQKLIKDKELGLSPYVSVGVPVSTESIDGHVFCFLPQPREDTSLTGLPVHINGFFALNQSRHHVKWSTEEQAGHDISDKNVLWNKYLMSETLPLAYKSWFQKALQLSKNSPHDTNLIETIHRAIPVSEHVQGKWQNLLPQLFEHLKSRKILYARTQNSWVSASDALFPDHTYRVSRDCQAIVDKALNKMNKYYVEISCGQVNTLSEYFKLDKGRSLLTPSLLAQMLRSDRNQIYKSMCDDDKMKLIEFVLQDNRTDYLKGLELLPLASGRWAEFNSNTTEKIYLCDSEEAQLFTGMEDKMLLTKSKFPNETFRHFENMSQNDSFQLKVIDQQSERETLLHCALKQHIPNGTIKTIGGKCDLLWLQNVWKYLLKRSSVSICKTVPVLPILTRGTWNSPEEVSLVKFTDTLIIREQNNQLLPDKVVHCLKALSFDVVPSIPAWLSYKDIEYYVYRPNPESVVKILSNIQRTSTNQEQQKMISEFNNLDKAWRKIFMEYICDTVTYHTQCKQLLAKLNMFENFQPSTRYSDLLSVNNTRSFVVFNTFPVTLPKTCIDGSGKARNLLEKLGAEEITYSDLIVMTLTYILNRHYSERDVLVFMKYLLKQFVSIKQSCPDRKRKLLIQYASNIPFLNTRNGLKKPSDLFDPFDTTLQDLFKEESVFPEDQLSQKEVNILLSLGLKTSRQLTPKDIVSSARLLDNWSRKRFNTEETVLKANALLKVLSTYPQLLEEYYDGKLLKHTLYNLEMIKPLEKRTVNYPIWLPWYSHANILCKPSDVKRADLARLVGSVIPVVECTSDQISTAFIWQSDIPTHILTKQFDIIKETFQAKYRPFLLDYLQQLYTWLNNHIKDKSVWQQTQLIWVDSQFCRPGQVILDRMDSDINLMPFFYNILPEFEEFSGLFETLGSYRHQNVKVLLETLSKIQIRKDTSMCPLALSILRRLSDGLAEITDEVRKNILIPIHSDTQGDIEFKRLEDCTYTDNPDDYLSDDDDDGDANDVSEGGIIYFVHKTVPSDVATRLGIRSLQRRHLINTEEINVEEWGQHEPLTTRLKTLIERGYVDGLSVPKELLQNADDAGATCLKFLYDERENNDSMNSLLNQGMKTCHGPSLWVYNDAKFTDDDFVNITKLNAATKRQNMKTIGKFGLGFCSVYNLTDVPSIVSGRNIVIFDPHKTHLKDSLSGNSPGLKIDLSKKGNIKLLRRNVDQFKPYNGIFGCDLSSKTPFFDGTLFRLPLRSTEEAKVSEIKTEPYAQRDMSELLDLFFDNAINLLLFMQNIQTIEVYHLKSSAKSTTEQELVFRVSRSSFKNMNQESVLSQFTSNQNDITEIEKLEICYEVLHPIQNIKPKLAIGPTKSQSSWVLSWATGTKKSKTLLKDPRYDNHIPLAAVAVPLNEDNSGPKCLSEIGRGSYKTGRLYCFLPIPGDIKLPWHLHGCFEVSSDRRQLKVVTEQDKTTHVENWNQCLLEDAGVNAFFQLLEYFAERQMFKYIFHKLWPIYPDDKMKPFVKSFFKRIVFEDISVFESASGWFSFKNITILDPEIRENKTIGEIAYTMLQHFPVRTNKVIIDLPRHVLNALKTWNKGDALEYIDSKIVSAEEMLQIFFMNISDIFWDTQSVKRNDIVKYALKSQNRKVHQLLKATKCIPCVNKKELRTPEELIHPNSAVSSMFCEEDCMFPVSDFRENSTLEALVKHGMIDRYLPIDILLKRIKSIETCASQCTICAKGRIKSIVDYLKVPSILDQYDEDSFSDVRETFWLPVLQKPNDWQFTWFADNKKNMKICQKSCCNMHNKEVCTLVLGKSDKLYRCNNQDYIASVSNVIDETNLGSVDQSVWRKIGIGNIDSQQGFEDVVDQLVILADEYDATLKNSSYSRLYRKVVQKLQSGIKKNEEWKHMMKRLSDKQFILVNKNNLVKPYQVAFEVKQSCFPFLCTLPEQDKHLIDFFKAVGVVEMFSDDYIINALVEKSKAKNCLERNDIDQVICILLNLVDFFERHDKTYMDYKEYHNNIVGPDLIGCLHPTHELALADQTFSSSVEMKIIHDAFPPFLAKQLGVISKKRKCLEYISCGIPWGQKEKLETRIQGILKDYPCDDSILKELLQNADDANAKELHFIMDFRRHSTDTIIGKGNIQEPSLCVYNDGYFTEDDLRGITNLGIGSKRKDASKTGQFGIGFNAVYHLTDTPSFLTKGPGLEDGVLCILDPLCCDIPVDVMNPGLRFSLKEVKRNYPNSLSGYLEQFDFFKSGKGTMFRFPLRRKVSTLSLHTIANSGLRSMLNSFSESILDSLLFVKSVEKIQISSITDKELTQEYSLTIKIDEEDRYKREQFFRELKSICKRNENNALGNLNSGQIYVNYEVEANDSKGNESKWIIFQTFGCIDGEIISKNIIEAFKDENLAHLPIGGIAVPYPDFYKPLEEPTAEKAAGSGGRVMSLVSSLGSWITKGYSSQTQTLAKQKQGKLFAFLPLPVETGFKVHINSNFSLDHSRRDIWKEGYRLEWNEFLTEKTIVVSWINALKYLQRHFTECNFTEKRICTRKQVTEMLNEYHDLFPTLGGLHHELSKVLVKMFYDRVYKDNIALFPSVEVENTTYVSVKWVPLKADGKMFGTVFKGNDTIENEKLYVVLKQIGMTLIETPNQIYNSLKELEYQDITLLDPDFVITFMHSFQNEDQGSCCIGNIDIPIDIENTSFCNTRNLKVVVDFISKASKFSSKVENLPVLLTADEKLHVFRKGSTIYCSNFYNLLPCSKSAFVHCDFISLYYDDIYFTEGFFQRLDIENFKSMLKHEEAIEEYTKGIPIDWDKTNVDKLITAQWIQRFFLFIKRNSSKVDPPHFAQNIAQFNDFCVLPAIFITKSCEINKLIPIAMAHLLFHDNKVKYDVAQVIQKLQVPHLDESVFSDIDLKEQVISILPNTNTPFELLKCVHFHMKNTTGIDKLTAVDAHKLLSYFNHHVDDLKKHDDEGQFLREIPLHLTFDNRLVSIAGTETIILSCQIPMVGIHDLATGVNKIVLRENAELVKLYQHLCLSGSDVTEFYADILVPTINHLPQIHWYKHFSRMRDLIKAEGELSKRLLAELLELKLFKIGSQMRKASELYWYENSVFKELVDDNLFPPQEYRTKEWKNFCKSLKMHFDVTDELLLEFACTIESTGQHYICEKVRKQSDSLLNHFYCHQWKDETLLSLRHIKFICPHQVDQELTSIHAQPDSCSKLIAFSQSISSDHRLVCWSSINMLSYLPCNDKTCKLLNIYPKPPVDKVILHCQNITTVLQNRLGQRKAIKRIEAIMEKIYDYFRREMNNYRDVVANRLETFPIVYIPEHKILVRCKAVIIEMDSSNEIIPYLYKAPTYYGRYFDLFQKMGAKKNFEFSHCAFVLAELKLKVEDNVLMPEELSVIKKVLLYMTRILETSNEITFHGTLFLPNRERILRDSKCLTVSNRKSYEKKLRDMVQIEYFLDFSHFDIKDFDQAQILRKLPANCRPMIFSDLCKEVYNESGFEIVENSLKALKIEGFLHSNDFIGGFLRLYKHFRNLHNKVYNEEIAEETSNNIRSIQVISVSNLKSVLSYQGVVIDGSQMKRYYYVKLKENERIMYVSENDLDMGLLGIFKINDDIKRLLQSCIQDYLYLEWALLPSLTLKIDNPVDIDGELDRHEIDDYDLPQHLRRSLFPVPGTYVEECFLPFLEAAIHPFTKNEFHFVAMELDDSALRDVTLEDVERSNYIYVHILGELKLDLNKSDIHKLYRVNTGNSISCIEEVPIYRLYRFVRRGNDTADLVEYDAEPTGTVAFDETCQRIRDMLQEAWSFPETDRKRIIRRLILKWHPDKNKGNEEYCKDVFNYIQSVILLLENGKRVSDIIDRRSFQTSPNMSDSTYDNLVRNASRQAASYARAYHDNVDDYTRSQQTGRYSHSSSRTTQHPDISEARRWMRQAKTDYKAANAFNTTTQDTEGHNWICYTCHQACEKALRAAHFSVNANEVPGITHNLSIIAASLGADIRTQVLEIERRLHDHNRMRYPNAVSRPNIPSDLYRKDDATFALEKTRELIDTVESEFDLH